MMNYRLPNWSASAHRLFGRAGVVAVLALTLAACDDPLAFKDPDFVRPEDLASEEAIPTLVNGAIGDFTLAYAGAPIGGGSTEGIVMASGLLAGYSFIRCVQSDI